MSIYGTLAGLMNVEARTSLLNAEAQDYGVLAQERQLNVQAKRQQQADDAIQRQIIMDTMNGVGTPQAQNGQMVDGGDPLIVNLQRQLAREQQTASQSRQIADTLKARGASLPYWQKADADANASDARATATERVYRQAQSDLLKQIGSVAGSAKDEDTFRQAYTDIAKMDPTLARTITVDRDENGIPFFGPRSRASMDMLRDRGMTTNQQMERVAQIKDEERRQAAEVRAQADEVRKQQETDSNVATRKVLSDERIAKTRQIEAKTTRLDTIATKPATNQMIEVARSDILAHDDFKDAKFDQTLNSFAAAVADRANQIRAEANRSGEDMDFSEARKQAIADLKGNVEKTKVGEHEIPFTGVKFGGEEKYTYRSGGVTPAEKPKGPATVNDKTAYDAIPSGTTFIGPDGKKWIKP